MEVPAASWVVTTRRGGASWFVEDILVGWINYRKSWFDWLNLTFVRL